VLGREWLESAFEWPGLKVLNSALLNYTLNPQNLFFPKIQRYVQEFVMTDRSLFWIVMEDLAQV
jgi:hypothetical protein